MLKTVMAFIMFILFPITILTGCGASQLAKTAQEVEKKQIEKEEAMESDYEQKLNEWKEIYEKYDKTTEEAIEEIEKETVKVNDKEVVKKQKYDDPNELAMYVADILYKFHKGEITPKEYITFLNDYGSEELKELYLTKDINEDLEIMENIQRNIINQGIHFYSYDVSTAEGIEDNKAVFYRKQYASNGQIAYYKTVLIKEKGNWYFHSDKINVPVNFDY